MAYILGQRSRNELEGVHPRLVAVVERAIEITSVDFAVHDGLRTEDEQREYVARGVSQTMASKHLTQADGYGHAVDLVPWIGGRLRWEWPPIFEIAAAVYKAAAELEVQLTWGGVWDRALLDLDVGMLEHEVNQYVDRRRAMGHRRVFIDGPHFELMTP